MLNKNLTIFDFWWIHCGCHIDACTVSPFLAAMHKAVWTGLTWVHMQAHIQWSPVPPWSCYHVVLSQFLELFYCVQQLPPLPHCQLKHTRLCLPQVLWSSVLPGRMQIFQQNSPPHWTLLFHFVCNGKHYGLRADWVPTEPPPSTTLISQPLKWFIWFMTCTLKVTMMMTHQQILGYNFFQPIWSYFSGLLLGVAFFVILCKIKLN